MGLDRLTAHEVVESAGVRRAAQGSPKDAFAVNLRDTMQVVEDVATDERGIDDIPFQLHFPRELNESEQTVIAAVIVEWARHEQNRIYEEEPDTAYGWFHRVSTVVFKGDVAHWYIDTSCNGVKRQSIEALQEWMAGTPGPRATELMIG